MTMHILSASFAGERALAILRNNRTGVVRGSHDAGFYCRMEDGSLLLAHEDGFGVIPFGLGFPPMPPMPFSGAFSGVFGKKRFPEGMPLHNHFEDRRLLLGGTRLAYPAQPAPRRSFPWESGPDREALRSGLEMTAAILAGRPEQTVAASFQGMAEALHRPLRLLLACLRGDAANGGMEDALAALIGLGPGLTPLADDILCGLFAGGAVLEKPFPCPAVQRLRRLMALVDERALAGTSSQSAAYLRSAAAGEAFGLLDALLAAIYVSDAKDVEATLARIMGIGHSSGSGLVFGLVCALELAVGRHVRNAL